MARKAKKILKVNLDSMLNVTMAINHLEAIRRKLEAKTQTEKSFRKYCVKVTVPGAVLENKNTGTRYVVESIQQEELNTTFLLNKNKPTVTITVVTLRSEKSGYKKQVSLSENLFYSKFRLVATPKAAHVLYGQGFKSDEVILL
jgi:hypothetical protein